MEYVAGFINKTLLHNLTVQHTSEASEVRAAIAYADGSTFELLDRCASHNKPLTFFGRYDASVPIAPKVVKWFLDKKDLNLVCKLVSDFLHAKIIWWVGVGVYIGSANLTHRAWFANFEAGTFIPETEMEGSNMIEDMQSFFDVIDSVAHPINDEIYAHLVDLQKLNQSVERARDELEAQFGARHLLPRGTGLTDAARVDAHTKAYQLFQRRWKEVLQVLRDIAKLVVLDENRPDWIPVNVPAGAQADQFLHAYYYKFIQGGLGGDRVDRAFAQHRGNPSGALKDALTWWKTSAFEFEKEKRMLVDWAPRLRELFGRDRLPTLSRDEFVEALGMVHAVIDYGGKRKNLSLGLPSSPQDLDLKVRIHAEQLWDARTKNGQKTPLEVLAYVIWGSGEPELRIWKAARDSDWSLPWVKFSALGEIIGWARPDEYPPRNERTLKGLRGLGYPVRTG